MDTQQKMNKRPFWLTLIIIAILLYASPALAHGTSMQMEVVNEATLELRALFDTGEPMSEAQITVYAADNPTEAWHSGVADENGFYAFDVDTSIRGEWAISIRTAGHGEILHLNVLRNGTISLAEVAERPLWQTILIAVAVVAALGGIAYRYSRPNIKRNA
ncbi:MAG: hypothetical protein AAF614_32890 [Chloroflexota bacterium]